MKNKPMTSRKQSLIPSSASPTTLIPVSGNPEHNGQFVDPEDIRMAAYLKWEAAGKPEGDGVQFWSEAEQELQTHHE